MKKRSKSELLREKKIAEEFEILKSSVEKVFSYTISQKMLLERTHASHTVSTILNDFLVLEKYQNVETELRGQIVARGTTLGSSGLQGADVRTFSPTSESPSLQRGSSIDSEKVKNSNDLNKAGNRTESSVLAGNPYISPNTDIGSDEDKVTNAISDLLGSIFKGFRGDKSGGGVARSSGSSIDNENENESGGRKVAPEPSAGRVKAPVAVSDYVSLRQKSQTILLPILISNIIYQ